MSELTETTVRQYATPESFRRGRDYYEQGAVLSLARRGDQLLAEVEGSQYEPYRVRITFDEGGITGAFCSCPYDWGGWCKHVVAVLLACRREPDLIEERPTLDELLVDPGQGVAHGVHAGPAADLAVARGAGDDLVLDDGQVLLGQPAPGENSGPS